MLKFAKKNVKGWNSRHLNQIEVMRSLQTRAKNFTLSYDEQQFFDDTVSLYARYNKGSIFDIL